MNLEILDSAEERRRRDPGGMLQAIAGLAGQCRDAWAAAQALELPAAYRDIDRIIIAGMGGSAIAGDYWRVLLQRESHIPVTNVRQYDLPPFVEERTLVIASSFSGDTEETVSAFEQALATRARKLVVTAGGRLLTMARANGVPAFAYSFRGEPRAALGWSLMPLIAAGEKLGLTQGAGRDVEEAIAVLEAAREQLGEDSPAARNPAKQAAGRLREKLPVIYAGGPLVEVAHRWKTQLNESAKVWAFYEELPEIHHNAIIGYELPRSVARDTAVVFLDSPDLVHRRVQLRYQFTQKLLGEAGVEHFVVDSRGKSALAQMLYLTQFGDYVSAYLALLYGVDPTPTTVIDELKAWLAEQN